MSRIEPRSGEQLAGQINPLTVPSHLDKNVEALGKTVLLYYRELQHRVTKDFPQGHRNPKKPVSVYQLLVFLNPLFLHIPIFIAFLSENYLKRVGVYSKKLFC